MLERKSGTCTIHIMIKLHLAVKNEQVVGHNFIMEKKKSTCMQLTIKKNSLETYVF